MYPCGGMPQTNNRSFWPVSGGALAVQPGWFPGHSRAQLYVNIGIQQEGQLAPPNMSHAVVPPFEITGPTNDNYSGAFCLPQVRMPAEVNLSVGQNITLQVIELAQHGAALYSCVDLTLVEDGSPQVEQVTQDNCRNDSLNFELVFTTAALSSGAAKAFQGVPSLLALAGAFVLSAAYTLY
ncbi:hypothetical protein LTR17_023941 [Elasticomyces elasticus]|nr:hypothetical protein LTR17_023941 [Elasticomyces elasticus]